MGKGKRNRQQAEHSRVTPNAAAESQLGRLGWTRAVHGTPEAAALAGEFATDHEMPCRATFLDDPVFGRALQIVDDGTITPSGSMPGEVPPVLLFEPKRLVAMEDTQTGSVHELGTEALILAGLQRLSAPVWSFSPAAGWTVGCADEMVHLRAPDGDVMATGRLKLDPAWVSAAANYGYVLVIHGHPLGVALPPGKTERTYTAAERATELRQARRASLLAGGLVEWTGTFEDTFNWVLFRRGVFEIPTPVAYVPLWYFARHGGPQDFGFVLFDRPLEIPVADGLVANVTKTDIDLVRPDETDRSMAMVTGYHDGPEPSQPGFDFQQWRKEVLENDGLVVLAGRQAMPSKLGFSAEQDRFARSILEQSWGAKVALSEDSRADYLTSASARPSERRQREVIELAEQQAEYLDILRNNSLGLHSFKVTISKDVGTLIDPDKLAPWATNLWPITCQTCREPLGYNVDISVDGPLEQGKVLISMHHSSCRPSGVTPPDGVTMSCPTHSFAAGYIGDKDGKQHKDDFAVFVVNPSCEQLQLVPDGSGNWRNATLEAFGELGFTSANGKFPPIIDDAEVEVEIVNDYLVVTVTGYLPDMPDQEWAIKPPKHVLDQVRRLRGIAVSVMTKALPNRLHPEELPSAFSDKEALIGWVQLHPAE